MFPELLRTRRFAGLFWCQFLSALNDNFVKNALVILILFKIGEAEGATLVALAGAVLVAPFFFLSALGGEWADKYDKAELAEWLKRYRDSGRSYRSGWLLVQLGARSICSACGFRHHRGAVWPDQVRHPSRYSR